VRRWRSLAPVGSPPSAYRLSVRARQSKPNGTVRSPALDALARLADPELALGLLKPTAIARGQN
jgi:hypothetical protein